MSLLSLIDIAPPLVRKKRLRALKRNTLHRKEIFLSPKRAWCRRRLSSIDKKKYLQGPNAVNVGTTPGKYLVVLEGPARELFFIEGFRFEKGVTYMMANTWDMSEEKVIEEDKSDLEDDEELVFE